MQASRSGCPSRRQVGLIIAVLVSLVVATINEWKPWVVTWGIVLAGIGAYTMRASFVLLLSGVSFPDRVIRILDHMGPAVMAALVVTALQSRKVSWKQGPSS